MTKQERIIHVVLISLFILFIVFNLFVGLEGDAQAALDDGKVFRDPDTSLAFSKTVIFVARVFILTFFCSVIFVTAFVVRIIAFIITKIIYFIEEFDSSIIDYDIWYNMTGNMFTLKYLYSLLIGFIDWCIETIRLKIGE